LAERRSTGVPWRNPKIKKPVARVKMPLYEYECPECGRKLELRRSIAESERDVKCPECGKGILKRVLSLFSTSVSDKSCAPSGST
jgi:putative FmdB family regulatory protein